MAKVLAKTIQIVCEDCCLLAGAGDGYVAESGAGQVGVHGGIGADQDALRGEPLGIVAGDRIAVIEVPMLCRIEHDSSVVVEAGSNLLKLRVTEGFFWSSEVLAATLIGPLSELRPLPS